MNAEDGSYVDVASGGDCMVTTTGKDEYLTGYEDGLAKGKRDGESARIDIHHMYIVLLILVLFFFAGMRSCAAFNESREQSYLDKCSDMCEPYRRESCGYKARTATCRTVEGYVVRDGTGG